MILLLVLSLLACQEDPAALIEKLRSEDPAVRDSATKKLRELGRSARPALEKAAKDADGEVAARAGYVLRMLQLAEILTPNLQAAIPDVVERLAKSDLHNWTTVFFEATATDREENRKIPAITREDLVPLAANAVRGASTSLEKIAACWTAAKWRLKSAFVEMQKYTEDPDPQVRHMSVVWCLVLGWRDAAPSIAALLKDENLEVRRSAANHLAFIGTQAQIRQLQAVREDPDPQVRLNVARALGRLGDRRAVDTLISFLDTNLKGHAAEGLAELGRAEHSEKIASLLKEDECRWDAMAALDLLDARDRAEALAACLEKGPGTPGHAALILATWKMKAYAEKIAELVKNKPPGEYSLALEAVGLMGDARHANVLVPMLKDGLNDMRASAAEALERLDARDSMAEVAPLLKDEDFQVRYKAALALGKLASRLTEPDRKKWIDAIGVLEKDASESVRTAASISLIRMGAKSRTEVVEAVRRLESTSFEYSWPDMAAECTLALTQLYEPAGFAKLMREIELKRPIEDADSLEAALAPAGLKLVNPKDLMLRGRRGVGRVINPLDLVTRLVVPASWVIVEGETLRVATREESLEHWLKRLQAK